MDRMMSIFTKPNQTRIKYLIGLSAFVLLILLYNYFSPATSALKTPIEQQLQAIQVEDLATAYSYTTTDFQKATSYEAFKRYVYDYSGLRNNQSIEFNDRQIKNGVGTVKATLYARGGIPTAITYQLIKERNRWRINAMHIIPSSDEPVEPVTNVRPPVSEPALTPAAPVNTAATTTVTTTAPTAPVVKKTVELTQPFSDANYHYSLQYPASWDYTRADRGIAVFFKNDHQENHPVQLSVQPLDFDNDAERHSVRQTMEASEEAIKDKDSNYKVEEDGLLPPRANKNENYHGRYAVYSYTLNSQPVKHLQVVYFKSPARAQYIINYIAPAAQFDAELPTARAMITSFMISADN